MSSKLVYYGNETLKSVARKVANIDGKVADLVDTMFNIMYKENGLGLAAPQIDIGLRVITIDIEGHRDTPISLINPVLREVSQQTEPYEEGCLSLPGISAGIIRPGTVLVSGVTLDEKEVEIEASGLLARAFQHEIDHLNGVVFIDHLEEYLRKELRPQLKKIKRLNR